MEKVARRPGDSMPIPLSEILEHPKNWVEHTQEQVDAYDASYAEFGDVVDGIFNLRSGRLIDGHMRLSRAFHRGDETLKCKLVDLDDHKEERLLLSLRKIGGMAKIREDVLTELLLRHAKDEEGLPAGWTHEEIDIQNNGFSRAELEEDKALRETPATPTEAETPTRTRFGEIYRLGKHIVVIGDCTSTPTIVSALQAMEVGKVGMVFTDPPYNMEFSVSSGAFPDKQGNAQPVRPTLARIKEEGLDKFDPVQDWLPTMPLWFGWKGDRPGPEESFSLYVYCNDALVCDYTTWARSKNGTYTCLVWVKGRTPIPFANHHHVDTENLLWLKKRAKWNEVDKAPDAYRRKALYDDETSAEQQDSDCPCPKPWSLIANQLLLTSDPGDVVLDCFGWTGPTLIACEETARRCLYVDRNPRGADVCLAWWERMTGSTAEKIGTLEGESEHGARL